MESSEWAHGSILQLKQINFLARSPEWISNFKMPLTRDLLLGLGICSVSRRSCDNILTAAPGSSLMIVVGGAQEASNAHPNTNNLIIKKRLGFIKLALRNGSPMV